MKKIPDKIIYDQAIKENYWLREELKRKNAKIKEFKEWQRKVGKREIAFWIDEHMKTLHKNDELIEKLKDAKKFYELDTAFKKDLERFMKKVRDRAIMQKRTVEISEELCGLMNDVEIVSLLDRLNHRLVKYDRYREMLEKDFPEFLKEEAK